MHDVQKKWRRRQTSYNIARLPWQNSTPFFGAVAFCTTKIADLEDNLKNENDHQNLYHLKNEDEPKNNNAKKKGIQPQK